MTGPDIPRIELDELRRLVEEGAPFVLVDALSPTSFAHSRLPGAVNIPPSRVDELAARRIPDRATPVVVYCANENCESSVDTARGLVARGYTDVRHFAGGKQAWVEAALPVEGSARRLGAGS